MGMHLEVVRIHNQSIIDKLNHLKIDGFNYMREKIEYAETQETLWVNKEDAVSFISDNQSISIVDEDIHTRMKTVL